MLIHEYLFRLNLSLLPPQIAMYRKYLQAMQYLNYFFQYSSMHFIFDNSMIIFQILTTSGLLFPRLFSLNEKIPFRKSFSTGTFIFTN